MTINGLSMTAESVLACSIPEQLFNYDSFKEEQVKLQAKWHPDHNSALNAGEVFAHVRKLVEEGREKIRNEQWNGRTTFRFTSSSGKEYRIRYSKLRMFELGKMLIGKELVAYIIDEQYEDLYKNGVNTIRSFKYKNKNLEKEFTKLMPSIRFAEKTDKGFIVIISKPEGYVLLQDLIDFLPNNKLPPKHVAWIVSSLYNLLIFLKVHNTCHNGISPATVFVDTTRHSVMILGGWWYSTKTNAKLLALPSKILSILPKGVLEEKISQPVYDRQAMKATAIASLGDPSMNGSRLLFDKDVPKPMLSWLRGPSSSSIIDEYERWYDTLTQSFGERKFTKFEVDISSLY